MGRILVIDDHGIVRDTLKNLIGRLGHEVATASDGEAGLELFRSGEWDLVILDRDMPKMTGSKVLKKIKELKPEARVIIFTGHDDPASEEEYLKLGAEALMSKGLGMEHVIRILERRVQRLPSSTPAAPAPQGPSILVADDDDGVRGTLARYLQAKGFRVLTAADGRQALEIAGRERPALVLLDIDMPVMNGRQALEKIRALDNPPAVIMISGGDDEAVARECLEKGARDYIQKPLNFDYLETSLWTTMVTLGL